MQFSSDNPPRDFFAALNLLIFLVTGLWLLHRRIVGRADYSVGTQLLILLWALLTCGLEMAALRGLRHMSPVLHIFSVLGLFTATVVLYGHHAVSLATRLLVDLVMAPNDSAEDRMRMGTAEALERGGDYAAAHQEYLAISRIFPGNGEIHARMADNLLRMGRDGEAADCLERAFCLAKSPQGALAHFLRLAGLLEKADIPSGRMDQLARRFLESFPGTEESEKVIRWLGERAEPVCRPQSAADLASELAPLESHPIHSEGSRH